MSAFALKMIGAAAMLLDHIGRLFFEHIWPLRAVGRLAFPIFAFLIVEGAVHTRHYKKYVLRMLIFALVSEIPYNLVTGRQWLYTESFNVLGTFVIGLLCIWASEQLLVKNHFDSTGYMYSVLVFAAGAAAAGLAGTDYGAYGIVLIYIFYTFREKKFVKMLPAALIFGLMPGIQFFAVGALVILLFYNGREGYKNPAAKWGFYMFYPLHLFVLYMIRVMI